MAPFGFKERSSGVEDGWADVKVTVREENGTKERIHTMKHKIYPVYLGEGGNCT